MLNWLVPKKLEIVSIVQEWHVIHVTMVTTWINTVNVQLRIVNFITQLTTRYVSNAYLVKLLHQKTYVSRDAISQILFLIIYVKYHRYRIVNLAQVKCMLWTNILFRGVFSVRYSIHLSIFQIEHIVYLILIRLKNAQIIIKSGLVLNVRMVMNYSYFGTIR